MKNVHKNTKVVPAPEETSVFRGKKGDLPPAARRALAEAEERRNSPAPNRDGKAEINGRKGPDPVRFGDWEKDGIISDF